MEEGPHSGADYTVTPQANNQLRCGGIIIANTFSGIHTNPQTGCGGYRRQCHGQ